MENAIMVAAALIGAGITMGLAAIDRYCPDHALR